MDPLPLKSKKNTHKYTKRKKQKKTPTYSHNNIHTLIQIHTHISKDACRNAHIYTNTPTCIYAQMQRHTNI